MLNILVIIDIPFDIHVTYNLDSLDITYMPFGIISIEMLKILVTINMPFNIHVKCINHNKHAI
jgi:hypothetical protein